MAHDTNVRSIQDFARDMVGWLIKCFVMAIWTEQAVWFRWTLLLPLPASETIGV